MTYTLSAIAEYVGGEVVGEGQTTVKGLSPIDDIEPGTLVYAEGDDNVNKAKSSEAVALIVAPGVEVADKPYIVVKSPSKAFLKLLTYFYPTPPLAPAIHQSACIAEDVVLGEDVYIGPYVVIESGVCIGANTVIHSHAYIGREVSLGEGVVLHPHVTLYPKTQVGNRVVIHASTVIGSDGFGYQYQDGAHQKVPHVGNVVIEDDVEIGANTVIDRATLGSTRIGKGTKIDNLVQVAHSVQLGEHNILCAFTGIAGSTKSGSNVIFAADVGVSDHVTIDSGVILAARAGVPPKRHLKAGNVYVGTPARPREKAQELELSLSRIPLMRKNMKSLSEKVDAIAKQVAKQDNA